ncbi:hypothetical protein BGP75_20540 [Motiliproteus sp. MSK22-1]|nr:hypothetical protein BGP75_20540 [Motiliproteus sp. MSK22-1]
MGFEFSCAVNLQQESDFNQFFDGLGELIEARNLLIEGGGSANHFEGYVMSNTRYESATEEDRKAIESWLTSQDSISDTVVDKLSDAYYGY